MKCLRAYYDTGEEMKLSVVCWLGWLWDCVVGCEERCEPQSCLMYCNIRLFNVRHYGAMVAHLFPNDDMENAEGFGFKSR